MQVYFHIGPHKTGTSSIQFLLRGRYGSDTPQPVWYPQRTFLGATGGHTRIADQFRPLPHLYSPFEGLRQLEDVVDEARAAGVDKLILSSENFSFATSDDLQRIRSVFPESKFNLILAATPIVKRMRSQWSTRILNGGQTGIEDGLDLLPLLPGLQKDFYSRVISALTPSTATLLAVGPNDGPDWLLLEFLSVCGLDAGVLSEAELAPKNTSLDYYQSQLLIRLNELYEQSAQTQPGKIDSDIPLFSQKEYRDIRIELVKVFRGKNWRLGMSTRTVDTPPSLLPALKEIADAHRASIETLVAAGHLRVVGNIGSLHAGLESSGQREAKG